MKTLRLNGSLDLKRDAHFVPVSTFFQARKVTRRSMINHFQIRFTTNSICHFQILNVSGSKDDHY